MCEAVINLEIFSDGGYNLKVKEDSEDFLLRCILQFVDSNLTKGVFDEIENSHPELAEMCEKGREIVASAEHDFPEKPFTPATMVFQNGFLGKI